MPGTGPQGQIRIPAGHLQGSKTVPVAAWKASVLARIARNEQARTSKPAIRVKISIGFVALALLVGARHGLGGSVMMLAVLSSVLLVHELARALFARAVGCSSEISISAAGGQTELSGPSLQGISVAAFAVTGSLANALFAVAAVALAQEGFAQGAAQFLHALVFSHAVWGGLQLLPVIPARVGVTIARGLSPSLCFAHASASLAFMLVAGALLVNETRSPLLLALILLLVIACLRHLLEAQREHADAVSGIDGFIAEANARLVAGENIRAAELAREALAAARSIGQRAKLWKALAWAAVGQEDPFLLNTALLSLCADQIDVHLLAASLCCWNHDDSAIELLEEARALGYRSLETTKLLIELRFRLGQRDAVLALAHADKHLLSLEDWVAIEGAVATAVRE
jgi:hypothetical protein